MGRLRAERGAGLVDATICIFILMVAGLIFGAAFPCGFASVRQAGDNGRATAIAQQKVEQVRSLGYESLNYGLLSTANPPMIDQGDGSSPFSFTDIDSVAAQLPSGSGTMEISEESPTVKRIVVTVSYQDANGVDREVVLTTFVSDKRPKVMT